MRNVSRTMPGTWRRSRACSRWPAPNPSWPSRMAPRSACCSRRCCARRRRSSPSAWRRAQRRSGVARALLGGFYARARSLGATRVVLEVAADNAAALALYEAEGFRTVGIAPCLLPARAGPRGRCLAAAAGARLTRSSLAVDLPEPGCAKSARNSAGVRVQVCSIPAVDSKKSSVVPLAHCFPSKNN